MGRPARDRPGRGSRHGDRHRRPQRRRQDDAAADRHGDPDPDAGTVTVDGLSSDANWREYHRRIGFLSAGDRGLYNRFSVRGHLEYGARIAFVPRARRREAVDEALVRFGLTDLATRRADRLSQGQRQRLRLALTVVHDPKVLLLDEPRNSLDDEGLAMLIARHRRRPGARGAR